MLIIHQGFAIYPVARDSVATIYVPFTQLPFL